MTRRVLALGALLAAVAALAVASGCGSLDKDALRGRLLALPGNAEARDGWRDDPPRLRAPREGAPRLLLVHGTPGTALNWSAAVFGDGGLAAHFDVTALELPSHGVRAGAGGDTTFRSLAGALVADVERLGGAPYVLVGHSYGGEVAWRAALDRPDLFDGLVLVGSAGYPREDDEWLPEERAMREWPGAGLGWLLNAHDRTDAALAPHFRGAPPETFAGETFLVCENAENWRAMVALARDENGERAGELTSLSVPTLLVWGEHDVAYPVDRFARRFERDVPRAELVVVPGAGHYPPQETPAAFAELLRQRFAKR